MSLNRDPCVEYGSDAKTDVDRIYEEPLLDGIDQGAHVRYWSDPRFHSVESMAALKRIAEVSRAPETA